MNLSFMVAVPQYIGLLVGEGIVYILYLRAWSFCSAWSKPSPCFRQRMDAGGAEVCVVHFATMIQKIGPPKFRKFLLSLNHDIEAVPCGRGPVLVRRNKFLVCVEPKPQERGGEPSAPRPEVSRGLPGERCRQWQSTTLLLPAPTTGSRGV